MNPSLILIIRNTFPTLAPLVEKRLSLAHQNFLSLAHFGSPATYMPAVMLIAGECYGALGIKKLPLAHLVCALGITFYPWRTSDRCAGDKILENLKKKKFQNILKL
jgi:hypothetical protein